MSNQFPGPKKGKGKSLWENLNLVSLLGNLKRDNTKFKGYAENPEFFDQAGKEGVKFRNSPFNRAFALGNTVFMNQKQVDRVADYEHGMQHQGMTEGDRGKPWTALAKDEMGHVAQYREKGLLGFFGRYIKELAGHGFNQDAMYKDEHSLEGFHHAQRYTGNEEKARLLDKFELQSGKTDPKKQTLLGEAMK